MSVEIIYYSHGRTRRRNLEDLPYEPTPKERRSRTVRAWCIVALLLVLVGCAVAAGVVAR